MNPSNPKAVAKILILIVDDHELSRYGLSMALNEMTDLAVIGEAENGQKGVEMALEKKPDVILMDIGMPVMDGISATLEIKRQLPDIKIIMLTSIQNHEEVLASMAAGADAYCMKDIKIGKLQSVIKMVLDGAVWLDPAIARKVMQMLSKGTQQEPKKKRLPYNADLTDREMDVLKLIVDGKSNKDMGLILGISEHTIKAHVGNIIQKLSVDDRTQVAVKALRDGILNPESRY